jgi:hypothetical protein
MLTPSRLLTNRGRITVGTEVFTSLTTAPLKVVSMVADRGDVTGRSSESLSRRYAAGTGSTDSARR